MAAGGLGNVASAIYRKMYELSSHIHDKVRQSILITGSARSGTTIFGKLIGSLQTVEYFFEPPMLFSLFALLDQLPSNEARLLFDTFVYEELLIGALSGRMINLRSQDDSSIYNTKTETEVARRMRATARKSDIETETATIAVKLPDFIYRLTEITEILGVKRLLISIRDPSSTISSLLRRGWFTDTALQAGDITWPNRFNGRVAAPHWIPFEWLEFWDTMNEADRAALYFITQTNLTEKQPKTALVFDYEQMVRQPRALLKSVADHLGLSFGPRTESILAQVKTQETTEKFDLRLLQKDLRERAEAVYAKARTRCLEL